MIYTIYVIINMLFIKHFFVGFMVSEILRVSLFGYFALLIYVVNIYPLLRYVV